MNILTCLSEEPNVIFWLSFPLDLLNALKLSVTYITKTRTHRLSLT